MDEDEDNYDNSKDNGEYDNENVDDLEEQRANGRCSPGRVRPFAPGSVCNIYYRRGGGRRDNKDVYSSSKKRGKRK